MGKIKIGGHTMTVQRDRTARAARDGATKSLRRTSSRSRKASVGEIDHAIHVHQDQDAAVDLTQISVRRGRKAKAIGDPDRVDLETRGGDVRVASTIAELREQWRRRQAWHRAEKALTLQAKALCRRLVEGDKDAAEILYRAAIGKGKHDLATTALAAIFPLTEASDGIERHRKIVEKRLAELAGQLPIAPWVDTVRGFGIASLSAIVGEAGDLSDYANPAKLWKRMGLAVMSDGTRQRRISGAEALDHGYSPSRRSVAWNIGACLLKAGGPYKKIYDARKAIELERVETKGHAHNRAQRYVEKRLLRDLWVAWHRRVRPVKP